MKRILMLLISAILMASVGQSQDQAGKDRVVHNNPAQYRELSGVHAGAGKMGFTQLIGSKDVASNFLYLHAGVIQAKSGIGHHFHHGIEEMYILLTGEGEFTVNGRTSKLKAPVAVPCKQGDSHAIYNASNEPIRWLNFAVSQTKGKGDAFDLGDNRVGVPVDKVPVFVSYQLKREGLKDVNHPYAGAGSLARTAFGPEVFNTNWQRVDHLVIPTGKSSGLRALAESEEIYYVISGSGAVTINSESKTVTTDDAFAVSPGESISLSNTGSDDLVLIVIAVSLSSEKNASVAGKPKAMALQMDFVVARENSEAFERMYRSIYVPAMTVQPGYLGSKLLRLFPETVSKEIQAEPTTYNYQIQISFDTEENRRKWVASKEHQIAWPAASGLAKEFKWRGYDLMGDDDQR